MQKTSVIGLLVVFFLQGCASIRAGPVPVVNSEREIAAINQAIGIVDGQDNLTPFLLNAASDKVSAPQRNSFVLARMYGIDLRYREFETQVSNEARNSNFLLRLVSIGLSGAGALISVSGTQAILAGIDTGLKGASEAFSKDVLVDQTVTALTNQMRLERSRVRRTILLGLQQSIEDYPVFLALSQLDNYYQAGTLQGAIAGVGELIGVNLAIQQRETERIEQQFRIERTEYSPSEIVDRIEAFLNVDPDTRMSQIAACYAAIPTQPDEGDRPAVGDLLSGDGGRFPDTVRALAACLNDEYDAHILLN